MWLNELSPAEGSKSSRKRKGRGVGSGLGKTAGKDVEAAKCTYPALVGIEKSRELERTLANEAIDALSGFGAAGDRLRRLALALLERTK